nr:cation transporter [candidate division Zixibacteria bacterium]
MRKALFFSTAIFLGLTMIGSPTTSFACGGGKDSGVKMSSSSGTNATLACDKAPSCFGNCDKAVCGAKGIKTAAVENTEIGLAAMASTDPHNTMVTFAVEGMTCSGCENQVKTALMNTGGVNEVVKVSYQSGAAIVKYDSEKVKAEDLVKAVKNLGYEASLMTASIAPIDKTDANQKTEKM